MPIKYLFIAGWYALGFVGAAICCRWDDPYMRSITRWEWKYIVPPFALFGLITFFIGLSEYFKNRGKVDELP